MCANESNVVSSVASSFGMIAFCQILWYMNDIFWEANKRPLTKYDVMKISKDDSASHLNSKLQSLWNKQLQKKNDGKTPDFAVSIMKFAAPMVAKTTMLLMVLGAFKIIQTYFLRYLIQSLYKDSNERYYWAACLSFAVMAGWLMFHQYYYAVDVVGARFKSAIITMIFSKALKLSHGSLNQISTGHVVTLISSDCHKLQQLIENIGFIFVFPFLLAALTVALWYDYGISCVPGIAIMCVCVLCTSLFGKYFAYMRHRTVYNTDKRVNATNEVITSMQVTKMYCWEKCFSDVINATRKKETSCIMRASLIHAANNAMMSCSPHFIALGAFATFYVQGGDLSLAIVLHTIALIIAVRLELVKMFPYAIQILMETRVSWKRIEAFLQHEEIEVLHQLTCSEENENSKELQTYKRTAEVTFQNVTATWDDISGKPVFDGISFSTNSKNNLMMIVGPIGSGKTSILMAVLNELNVREGIVTVNGSIAYSSQQPWVFSGTLRQNILFGKEFHKEFYDQVIEACALVSDIKSFDRSDLTLVGEKGVSLSGGQRARISLARAMYRDADIYLLDDPLSAVDAKVGRHIFENCIRGLLKDKIVILVTHQLQYLQHATQIIHLESNTVHKTTVLNRNGVESQLSTNKVDDHAYQNDSEEHDQLVADVNTYQEDLPLHGEPLEKNRSDSLTSSNSISSVREPLVKELDANEEGEELRSIGAIPTKLYYNYITQGLGIFVTVLLIFVLIIPQCSLTFTDIYLANWVQGEEDVRLTNTTSSNLYIANHRYGNLYVFASLILINFVMNILKAFFFYASLIKCSGSLHNKMFQAVVKAPIYFFDTNPIGNILNRFSRDVLLMDEDLAWCFFDFANLTLLTLFIVVLNCVSLPYIAVCLLPCFIIFLFFRKYFLTTAREIKRLESIARSPLYTHLSAALSGLSTIRAFNLSKKILNDFYECLDYQMEAWTTFFQVGRWFGIRIDFLALLFNVVAIFAPVVAINYTDIDPVVVSVALTYAMSLCGMFQFCVRLSVDVDNLMVSTERVFEYSKLEPEEDSGISKDLSEEWPHKGVISARNASYAYHATLPNVLQELNFTIKSNEKIGVVGRTGSGKSSLLNMLFRMGVNHGVITIDDRDISELKLKDLRSSMSVIPQDPVLFSGSLRKNLDPFCNYEDEEIWQALEEVQMKKFVSGLKNKLETEITESGSNLSVGERQLLCLARAILKNNKILVIDEATANVDYETDSLIQRAIREKFKDCTVLTVAHRLNTIMDSNRIMVLDAGRIVEFDAPYKLLQNKSSMLRKLVDQTGTEEASKLELLAENAKKFETNKDSDDDDAEILVDEKHGTFVRHANPRRRSSNIDGFCEREALLPRNV